MSVYVLARFSDVGLCNLLADALGSHIWLPRLWAASATIWSRVRSRAMLLCELAWNLHRHELVVARSVIAAVGDEELVRWLRTQSRQRWRWARGRPQEG